MKPVIGPPDFVFETMAQIFHVLTDQRGMVVGAEHRSRSTSADDILAASSEGHGVPDVCVKFLWRATIKIASLGKVRRCRL